MGGSLARTGLPAALTSATYNAANQMTARAGATLTYDSNGNLTSDGAKTYAWNARDQMMSMTGASFAYDAAGRRKSKTVGGSTTSYFYDGANPVQEQGAVSANTLGGLAMDEVYQRTDAAGARSLQTDGLGSVLGLMDAGGTALTQYTYEPFGSATAAGVGSSNPFGFTGREEDGTGLMYYRARYYSPGMQRFVSEDPLGFGGGDVNLYGYVGNNPTTLVDPLGLRTVVVVTFDKAGGITHGSHSAVYLTNTSDGGILYDPAGSYRSGTRPSNGVFSADADNVGLDDYVRYHDSTGSTVRTFSFDTTQEEEIRS